MVILKALCILCDGIHDLGDNSFVAKQLRNKPGKIYICKDCEKRIKDNTEKRISTGKFKLYRKKKSERETLI